jgi:hypothetical protein
MVLRKVAEPAPTYAALKVADLKFELHERKLKKSGTKKELVARLEEADETKRRDEARERDWRSVMGWVGMAPLVDQYRWVD